MKNYLFPLSLRIVWVFLFCFFCHWTKASQTFVLEDSFVSYRLKNSTAVLEDPEGLLSLKEVIAKKNSFVSSEENKFSWGITADILWTSFTITNHSSAKRWWVEIGNPSLYEVDLYQEESPGRYEIVHTGAKYNFQKRSVKSNQLIIPIDIAQGQSKVFYIRVKSRVFLRLPLRIATMQEIYEHNHFMDMLNGAYFGLLIALMLYNFFVYISLQDKTYFFYLLYVLFFGLNLACLKGYGIEFLWPEQVWLNNSNIFCALCIFCGLTFTNSFLHIEQYAPGIYRLRWIVYASLLLVVVLTLAGYHQLGYQLIIYNPAYIYHFVGFVAYQKGFKPAQYYVLGFGVLVVGIIIFDMKEYGLLEVNLFTDNALQIGSACEAIILSLAMADKLNFYVKKKEEIQRQALLQATQFSHKLIQSQENERKRIAADLHDSLGQSIILIKNKVLLLKSQTNDPHQIARHLETLTEMVTDTIQEVRNISYKLRPFQLDLLGLTHSIRSLVEEVAEVSKIVFQIKCDAIDTVFSKDNEINIYRIIQECLNNMVKHSHASQGIILIRKMDTHVLLHIEDNGRGFTDKKHPPEYTHGFGLTGIKERLNILGGEISITDAFPHGTVIEITLPLKG